MTASTQLINAIAQFEGCRLTAYKCPAGVWTIGYGHTGNVKQGMTISQSDAVALLRSDLKKFEEYVEALHVCKTQGQFDALVDFAYNCGCANLAKSTLLIYIREHKANRLIQAQFLKWNKVGKKQKNTKTGKTETVYVELAGLTKRRQWEAKRWVS